MVQNQPPTLLSGPANSISASVSTRTQAKAELKRPRQRVLGPRRAPKMKNPLATIPKVRTYEAVQKAKRLAHARYATTSAGAAQPLPSAPACKFKRGCNFIGFCDLISDKALQEIKYYQKESDQLFIAKAALRRVCQELTQGAVRDLFGPACTFHGRFTKESVMILQIATEKFVSDHFAMS